MEFLLFFLILAASVIAFALLTNLYRDHQHWTPELKPNCLLTRHPVVFVTGLRSVFYFRKYWNSYPQVLAEHGYEVFTLHLPWNNSAERRVKMQDFLKRQRTLNKKYHFICDEVSGQEFKELFEREPVVASVTRLTSDETHVVEQKPQSFALNLAYKFHSWRYSSVDLPKAQDLGVNSPTALFNLLERMQELGEQDFLA